MRILSWLMIWPLFLSCDLSAQKKGPKWDLHDCINYALQNNIQIKKAVISTNVSSVSLEQAQASRFPSLNASISQAWTGQQSLQGGSGTEHFTGDYNLRSSVTLFGGREIANTISMQRLDVESGKLSVEESEDNIEIAVTASYLQILYAKENLTDAENNLDASRAGLNQARIQYRAGYISESSLAQLQSQFSNDEYNRVQAQNALEQQILTLKQLLELGIDQELDVVYPDLNDSMVMAVIPDKEMVYDTALNVMPEVRNSEMNIDMAVLNSKIARAGLLPGLSMNASIVTGNSSNTADKFATQLKNNLYENIGLTLNIPLFNWKQSKSAVEKADLAVEDARLQLDDTRKTLLSKVETTWLNAVSAQSRLRSSVELLNSAKISYDLVQQQFRLGMISAADLLTEKVRYLSAEQEHLQARYSALLNYKLLDFYLGKPITL